MSEKCVLCGERPTTACRGTIEKEYLELCSFHAGSIQMILEKLNVQNSVKWKPITEKRKSEVTNER